MKTNQRREAALKILASTGMRPSDYLPPVLRLMWLLGLDVPPPHFASFWLNTIVCGGAFGFAWGAIMWFMTWARQGGSIPALLIAPIIAGVLFGALMAVLYASGRRNYHLPSWHDLQQVSS